MAHSENNTLSSAFKTFFERETLTGPNFNEWQYDNYPPQKLAGGTSKMFRSLMFVEIYDLVDALHSCKQAPGKPVPYMDFGEFCKKLQYCIAWETSYLKLHALLTDCDKGFERQSTYSSSTLQLQKGERKILIRSKLRFYTTATLLGYWKRYYPPLYRRVRANKKKSEPVLQFQGFKVERKLSYGVQYLQVGNGTQAAVEAIGIAISVNGVFEIDMNNNVPKNNNNSIFSINKKRKLDLDSSYLWHCRLAHIGKTRMQKLHREGLLENIDEESFDKCESCISGKMTKNPFNKNIERATDLLGLIHTDVCGPLRHVSRKGASYFLTFTDDFSRYGYVYLLKHKHEVFETFKVFKAEVELQLGKKIKALRSDRGGEYLSQEFKDYLSENGIVQNLTSPYTPQQNGVSERRNQSAVRILNMVPTKKVDKTPYEIWHGKAPNLSYLKVWGCEAYVKRDSADKLQQRSVKSERTKRAPNRLCLNMEVEDDVVGDLGEPANYKTAMLDPDKVAKGCTTKTLWDCLRGEVSPVEYIRAIKILLAIAADGHLIWEQPEGYVDPNYPNGVCKLQRAIYGLKQASRQWNKRFDEEIKKFGFIQNRDEPCVYRKASGSDVVFLILYVDDILIMGNNIPRLKEVKDYLGKCFSVKDLGEAAYILGIKIYRDRSLRLIGLNQSAYIDKILKKFSMQNSKKGFIPMEVKHDLSNEMCASSDEEKAYMKKVPYASAVGSIMFSVMVWPCDKDDTMYSDGLCLYRLNGGAVGLEEQKAGKPLQCMPTAIWYMAASEAAMEAVLD
ncbi:retrotransposon protein, putative, ty1-copia subclass [Tanacetum coccineum]|uniref:Retrotransposon protein, putative, ty1-copia subclass n=1 Tax=Tanacetum coccineum TaxID=301880 RepID=A0ABQ4ZKH4_9ASTR